MFHFKSKRTAFWVKFAIIFFAVILVLAGALYGYYLYLFSGMEIDPPLEPDEVGVVVQDYHSESIRNIALFGIDTNSDSMVGRSDGIIIVTLDEERKEIRLSSIERDSYVLVEGIGKTKLNHAYAKGGPALAVKTLNQNFGLDIVDYLCINFTNLEQVIDELGGINLDVSSDYLTPVNNMIAAESQSRGIEPKLIPAVGYQKLNGLQVLCMMRERKNVGGTSRRAEMHELVLTACFEAIKEKSLIDYPSIAKSLLDLVRTTLGRSDVTGVATKVVVSDYIIRRDVFPLPVDQNGYGGRMIDGVWYLTFNPDTTAKHLQEFIYQGKMYGE
ncbi:MAG: LCP family protein [Clostridia bacterium]|nr:LCP family protein [Clostridia bacterium]